MGVEPGVRGHAWFSSQLGHMGEGGTGGLPQAACNARSGVQQAVACVAGMSMTITPLDCLPSGTPLRVSSRVVIVLYRSASQAVALALSVGPKPRTSQSRLVCSTKGLRALGSCALPGFLRQSERTFGCNHVSARP